MRKSQKHCFHLKKISSTIDLFFTFATVTYVLSASENTLMVFLQTNKISFSPTRVLTGSTRWGWQVRPSNPPISLSRGTENCHLLQWDKGEAQGQFPLGPVETLGEGGSCFSFSVGVWLEKGRCGQRVFCCQPTHFCPEKERIDSLWILFVCVCAQFWVGCLGNPRGNQGTWRTHKRLIAMSSHTSLSPWATCFSLPLSVFLRLSTVSSPVAGWGVVVIVTGRTWKEGTTPHWLDL